MLLIGVSEASFLALLVGCVQVCLFGQWIDDGFGLFSFFVLEFLVI
jgi:hypothetical protein